MDSIAMTLGSLPDPLPELHSTIVKEEPPDENLELEADNNSFCYETVTKEELIIEDVLEENNEAESDNHDSKESAEDTSNKKSLKCIECGKSYPTRYELNRHVKRHYALEMGLFRCKYCDKAYSTSQGLRRHNESHEKPQPTASKEKLSKKKLKSKSATKEKVIIEETVEANNEPESGTQDSKETVEISKNISLKCTECGKTFPKRFDLNRHIKRHEAMKMGLFRCKYCDKPYSTSQALQRHIESHEKSQKGSESATKEKVSIEDTIEANNEPESDSQDSIESFKNSTLKCTECGKTCPSRYELNRHAKMHVALKIGLYQCKYCDKALGTSQGLQRHIESHKKKVKPQSKIAKEKSESESATKEKVNIEDTVEANTEPEDIDIEILKNVSLKCTECGKTFPKRFELNRHLRRHKALNMGLFQCKYCDKPYSTSQSLQRHIESHNNKMEPQLTTAEKKSGSESATKEKVSIEDTIEANNEPESDSQDSKESSKNSTLNCTECGKTYPSRYELNRHAKRHVALKLGLYQCKYCDKALGTSQGFWRHIESHKKKVEPQSKIAKEKSESELATKEKVNIEDMVEANNEPEDIDIKILKNVSLKCTECEKTFPKRFELNRHLRKHKAMKIFDLNRHVKRQEALKKGLFRCKYCDKPYSTKQNLQRHIESHNKQMEPQSTTSKEDPLKEKSESGSVTKEKVIIEDTIEANNELETDGAGFSKSNHDGPVEKKETVVPKGRRSLSDSSTFSCPVCGQLYDWLYKLQAHMVKHKTETLGTEEFIIEDTAEENNVPETDNVDSTKLIKETCKGSTFQCIECDQTFPSRYERNRHVRKHFALKLGLYRCKYCEKPFSTSQGLERHIKSHEQNAGFSESSQDKPEEEKEISMEVSSVSSSFKCPVCGQMYDWLYKLKTHMLKHKVEKLRLFQCDLCNKYFRNRLRLNQHKTTHYNGQGRLACQLCPEQFLTRAELISHKVIHKTDTVSLQFKDKVVQKEDGTFNCTLCGKIYENRLKARRHFRIHLSELEKDPQDSKKSVEKISKGPFICTECDKIFPTRHERNRHVQRHNALKMGLYRCKYCEKPLSTSQGLDRHIKSHEQIREQCAGFSESSQDKPVEEKEISMVVPRGRRPVRYKLKLPKHITETLGSFECDLCNKFFHTRHHLSQHKLTHNMKQCRFSCQLCPEKFLTRAELFSHKKIHKTDTVSLLFKDKVVQKEDGTFNCTLCGKIYEKRLQAVRHFRIHLSELEKDIAKGQSTKHFQPTLLDCPECPLKFRNRDSLRSHIFKHTAIKLGRYTCTVCNKRCPSKIALTIHLEAHFKGFTRQSKFPSPS